MDEIKNIYSSLTDDELLLAVGEVESAELNGFFSEDSIVRELATKTSIITKMDVTSNLLIVQINILKESAYRWRLSKLISQKKQSNALRKKEIKNNLENIIPSKYLDDYIINSADDLID